MNVQDVIDVIESLAPPHLAEPDDPIGLHVGARRGDVTKALVALDLSEPVVREAVDTGADLIVTHHPFIYRPLKTVLTDRPDGRMVADLTAAGISVYCAHTNLDACRGGVNDLLAEIVGLEDTRPLEPARRSEVKLVTFVPADCLEDVRRPLCEAGAGTIGDYTDCSFTVPGVGTFTPGEMSDPHTGAPGQFEEADELRLEMVVPRRKLATVTRVLEEVHPYEEVAYDLYPIEGLSDTEGLGRAGRMGDPMPAAELTASLIESLDCLGARIVGDPDRTVKTAAVCGGAGGGLVKSALSARVDCYVTGDINYHTALEARDSGLVVIDIGHRKSELPVIPWLALKLSDALPTLEIAISQVDNEPFVYCAPPEG